MKYNKLINILMLLLVTVFASCSDKDEPAPADSDDNTISSFILVQHLDGGDRDYVARIDGDKIIVTIPYNIDLDGLTPEVVIPATATIMPAPSTIRNWNAEHVFRVKSFNGEAREYVYTVVREDITQNGDLVLSNMDEIKSFSYREVSLVDGNLIIGSDIENAEAITSLEGLETLKKITGNLIFKRSVALSDLTGLDNVIGIGGLECGTQIAPSDAKISYYVMKNLRKVDGTISIWNNNAEGLSFPALKECGELSVASEKLQTVNFEKLESCSGSIIFEGTVKRSFTQTSFAPVPNYKGVLSQLSFPELISVEKNLSVNFFSTMSAFVAPKLKKVGNIIFEYEPFSFYKFSTPSLQEVEGDLTIASHQVYSTIGVMTSCNEKLTSIDEWANLKSIGGTFTLKNFGKLSSLPLPDSSVALGGLQLDYLRALITLSLSNVSFLSSQNESPSMVLRHCLIEKVETQPQVNADIKVTLNNYDKCPYFSTATSLESLDCYIDGKLDYPINFGNVRSINGDIYFMINGGSTEIKFPGLAEVRGYMCVESGGTSTAGNLIDCPNLASVNGQLGIFKEFSEIKFPSLKNVNIGGNGKMFDSEKSILSLASFKGVNLPLLECVNGNFSIYNAEKVECPMLSRIEGFLGVYSMTGSIIILTSLKEIEGAKIQRCRQLSDFSVFGPFIQDGQITKDNWSVTGCKYNPTYQDMLDGKYSR